MGGNGKKRWSVVVTVCLVLLFSLCVLFACTGPGPDQDDANRAFLGTYYAFNNGVKDETDWIKLGKNKWTDSEGVSGRLDVRGGLILLYYDMYYGEDVLWHGAVRGNAFIWTSGDIGVAGEQWRKYYLDDGQNAGKDSTPYIDNTPGGPFGNGQTPEGGSGSGSGSGGSGGQTPGGGGQTPGGGGQTPGSGGQTPVGRCTVQFNSMGGGPVPSVQVEAGSTLTPPTTPDRPGYMFLGWYTQSTGGVAWDFASDRVAQDITLYAHWISEADRTKAQMVAQKMTTGLTDVFNVLASGTKQAPGGRGIDVTLSLGLSANQPDGAPLRKDAKVHLAVTTGASAAQNKILVELLMGEDPYLSFYLDGADHAYLGEALTQDGQQWFKVDSMGIQKLVANYFPYFAGVLADDELFYQQDTPKGLEMIAGYMSIIQIFVPAVTGGVVEEDAGGYTRYGLQTDFSNIIEQIPKILSNMGGGASEKFTAESIKEMLDSEDPGMGDLVDLLSEVLLGGDLEALFNGTISPEQIPDLRIEAGLTDEGALKELGIRYAARTLTLGGESLSNVHLHVALENMTVSTNAGLDIVPERVEQGVQAADELAIKASANIALPLRELSLGLDVYFIPDIRLDWGEASEDYPQGRFLGLDMSGTKAFVVGTINGQPCAELGAELHLGPWQGGSSHDQMSVLYLDVTGLYTMAGLDPQELGHSTKYKLEFILGGLNPDSRGVAQMTNAAGLSWANNPLDNVLAMLYSVSIDDTPMEIANAVISGIIALQNIFAGMKAAVTLEGQELTVDLGGLYAAVMQNQMVMDADMLRLDTYFEGNDRILELFDDPTANLFRYFVSWEKIAEFYETMNKADNHVMQPGAMQEEFLEILNMAARAAGLGEHYFASLQDADRLLQPGSLFMTLRGHRNAESGLGFQAELSLDEQVGLTFGVSIEFVRASDLNDVHSLLQTSQGTWTRGEYKKGFGYSYWESDADNDFGDNLLTFLFKILMVEI